MFSGPVTTMMSMPASANSLRARAVRCSYSALGNADSDPCCTSLLMSDFSDQFGGRSIEVDAETVCLTRPHGAIAVGNARSRIIDEPIGAVELGERGTRRAGDVKCRSGCRRTFVH